MSQVDAWRWQVSEVGVKREDVVSLEGEYGVSCIAAFLALSQCCATVVPLSNHSASQHDNFRELAEAEWRVTVDDDGVETSQLMVTGRRAHNAIYERLREVGHPDLSRRGSY